MSEAVVNQPSAATTAAARGARNSELVKQGLARRYAAERRFKLYGIGAIALALLALVILFSTIISTGYPAFTQTMIRLDVPLPAKEIDPNGTRDPQVIGQANFRGIVYDALYRMFPEVESRTEKRRLAGLMSGGASFAVRSEVMENPDLIGETIEMWVPASDEADLVTQGLISKDTAEADRQMSDQQIGWIEKLRAEGRLEAQFNTTFFTAADSRDPELAGIWGAAVGSFYTLLVTLLLSFPIGVMAAVYLEEFAPKNRWTQIIEVNINNLAAVPSIVFGLLGLAVFINFFGLPRSAPLVGGMVLSLMTLPTIIIAGRAALKSVPPSIREAALGLGASKMQVVGHHVLPLAMPGMLTGTIIGMAQALGETAPLLMIGMVAFIVDVPGGVTDPATVLPVQIFLWSDSPERAFVQKTSGAIMVLLSFLILMNALAVVLRKRFERRW
jgi:phosphate transport system permease protein